MLRPADRMSRFSRSQSALDSVAYVTVVAISVVNARVIVNFSAMIVRFVYEKGGGG
jgi:hypothetical protein